MSQFLTAYVTKSFPIGQLTENKYQQMIPTSKTLDIFIAIVFLDKPLEVVSREEIAQLRENISTLVHEYYAFKL